MKILEDIATTEAELKDLVSSCEGKMEEKSARLREIGVYRRYAAVFEPYLAVARSEPENLESLKRATFLVWYELNEPPPCFSGVGELPRDAGANVAELLVESARDQGAEFRWMLSYYFHLDPTPFADPSSHRELREALDSTEWDTWRRHRSTAMLGRGLMGQYWASIFESFELGG